MRPTIHTASNQAEMRAPAFAGTPLCPSFIRHWWPLREEPLTGTLLFRHPGSAVPGGERTSKRACAETRHGPQPPPRAMALSDARFALLDNYVRERLDVSLPTTELATVVGLSVSYFHRAFVLRTGTTPHSWVMELRLKRAQELMATVHSSLTAIAADCGFCDQAHMTNTFRRVYGMAPTQWRGERPAASARKRA